VSIEFVDATPVPPKTGGGRQADPNPYEAIVKLIAGKKDRNNTPIAKAFELSHVSRATHANDVEKLYGKIRRQLFKAGDACNPPVSVPSSFTPKTVNGKESATVTVVTFWTADKRTYTRKPKEATTNTETPAS